MCATISEVLRLFDETSKDVIVDYYKFAVQGLKLLQPFLDAGFGVD